MTHWEAEAGATGAAGGAPNSPDGGGDVAGATGGSGDLMGSYAGRTGDKVGRGSILAGDRGGGGGLICGFEDSRMRLMTFSESWRIEKRKIKTHKYSFKQDNTISIMINYIAMWFSKSIL